MLGDLPRKSPELAVVICHTASAQIEEPSEDESVVVALLGAADLTTQTSVLLELIRSHPSADRPGSLNLAYLLLFAGFAEDQVLAVSSDPEFDQLPVFMAATLPGDSEAIQRIIGDTRRDLAANPGFSIPIRGGGSSAEDLRAAAPQTPTPSRLPWLAAVGRRVRQGAQPVASGARTLASSIRSKSRGQSALAKPRFVDEEAALLVVVSIDGPGADRVTRRAQHELLKGVQVELPTRSSARWMVGSVSVRSGLRREADCLDLASLRVGAQGSAVGDELDLSTAAREILAQVNMDRRMLTRQGSHVPPSSS